MAATTGEGSSTPSCTLEMTMINDRTPRPVTESDVAVATFLARYTGPTRKTYTAALRRFQDWYGPDILHATRADIELFSHHLQDDEGLKRSTVAGYLVVLSSFYKVALADARITVDPTLMVRRPRVYYDPARLSLDRHAAYRVSAHLSGIANRIAA